MRVTKFVITFITVLALVSIGLAPTALGQNTRAYRYNDNYMRQLISRIENRSDHFSNSLEKALDRSRYNGTAREDEVNKMLTEFEHETDLLKDHFNKYQSTSQDVENVLRRAAVLDDFMRMNRMDRAAERDWSLLRNELDQLARSYNVAWRWGAGWQNPTGPQLAYRITDRQMQQLIQRIETRSDRFSRSLENALDRSALNGTSREDEINRLITEFEAATDQLKDRFNSRQSTTTDVQMVLQRAALINSVMQQNRFTRRAENDWTLLRSDLNTLTSAYSVAWNWNNTGWQTPTTGTVPYGYDALMTGTYRLNTTRSDSPQRIADNATRNLNYNQRQRVYQMLVNRLTPPEMLAIERRGDTVTLASTRSPQAAITVDGRERIETYPNGRTSRLMARYLGDQLSISTEGDRANDFTVTFDPSSDGRQLEVVRRVYTGRLDETVMVRSYYDKVSDVAQLNLYNTNGMNTTTTVASNDFIVPNGTELVAVLNNNLSTRDVRDNDRFTMTVRSPAQFDGAVINGYVTNINRSGRVSGRSEMTLNFDSIRLRNGSTYNFAGIVQSVTASSGETVRVDNEGAVRENDSRTNTTLTRTAIGTAVGAILGAIVDGGKGAAIGAAVGAGTGAGSVYVQGRDDLELMSGTQLVIRAGAPGLITSR